MLNELIEHINSVKKSVKKNLVVLDEEIDMIITNQEQSSQKIEYVLDTLLSCMDFGMGKQQFKKLNNYYKTFCPEFAKEYELFYVDKIEDYFDKK